MQNPKIEVKRERLRSLYRNQIKLNKEKKKLEEELLKNESVTGKREKIARKRKKDPQLPVSLIAVLLGCSRDRVYRLLLSGKLSDRHPVSVGRYVRTAGYREVPEKHQSQYDKWSKEARHWRHSKKLSSCKKNLGKVSQAKK